MRLCALARDDPSAPSVCMYDASSEHWVALVPAVQRCYRRGALRNEALVAAVRSVVAFLGADSEVRAEAVALAQQAVAEGWDGSIVDGSRMESKPFQPLSFRDAALYPRHLKQSTAGFVPLICAHGHLLQAVGMLLTKPLRLPDGLNPASRPAYYVGNPLTFIGDGETVAWPSHCDAGGRASTLDYELEVAVLITRAVSRRASPAEVAAAIGGFVLINDFSARCTQADELLSVGFGFVKSKSFATSMAREVVAAGDLWQPGDTGPLLGTGLRCDVSVNGEPRRGSSGRPWNTAEGPRVCSLEALVAFCALDEGLQPGELIGLGTVPDCCGLEIGRMLRPGDEVSLRVEGLGSLTNIIGAVPAAATPFKQINCSAGAAPPPGRLRTALRMLLSAVIAPPLLCVALSLGALAALAWTPRRRQTEGQQWGGGGRG